MYLNDMTTLYTDSKGREVVHEIKKKNFIISYIKQKDLNENDAEFYNEYVKLLLKSTFN